MAGGFEGSQEELDAEELPWDVDVGQGEARSPTESSVTTVDVEDDEFHLEKGALERACALYGLTGGRLALQSDIGELEEAYCQVSAAAGRPMSRRGFVAFKELVDAAVAFYPVAKRLRGEGGPTTAAALHDAEEAAKGVLAPSAPAAIGGPAPCRGTRPRLGLRRCRVLATAVTETERAAVERRERERWLAEVRSLLVEAVAPSVRVAAECMDPDRAIEGAAGAIRPSSLRGYVRTWWKLRGWLMRNHGVCWPSRESHLIDYVFMRQDEPCGATVPASFLRAVSWMERAAGFGAGDQLSAKPYVQNVVNLITSRLAGTARPTRRAPRMPVAVVAALERFTLNKNRPPYFRGVAWLRLVKVWGCMRYDDHTWLSPSRMTLHEGVLQATMIRTKTSGPAKKHRELPLVISAEAYVEDPRWLETGFRLWKEIADFPRDYFLPRGEPDGSRVVKKFAAYDEAAAAGQAVLATLGAMRPGGGCDGALLLGRVLTGLWTEHSERATLPSGLAVLCEDKTKRDLLGRWCPEGGSDVYVRTYRAIITELQKKFAIAAGSGNGYTLLDEGDLGTVVERWLVERGRVDSPEQAHQLAQDCLAVLRAEAENIRRPVVVRFTKLEGAEGELPAPVPVLLQERLQAEARPGAPDSDEDVQAAGREGQLLISYSKGRKSARLHRAGGCSWSTGRCAQDYVLVCKEELQVGAYDTVCRACWRGTAWRDFDPQVWDEKGETSDESDSTEVDGGSPPRASGEARLGPEAGPAAQGPGLSDEG